MKLEKDPIFEAFKKRVGDKVEPITLEDMKDSIRDINLNKAVPEPVKKTFEISKNLYIHSYFYYPFFTVSQHYAFLALESALRNRYIELFCKEEFSLEEIINALSEKDIISKQDKVFYDSGRKLRNALSHLTDSKTLLPSVTILERTSELINKLYQ